MNYKTVKVFNNNVVLAQEEDGKQVVLISKGVGFGVKKGSLISADGDDKKVFYILDENVDASKIKRLSYDIEQVEAVTRKIVELARFKLHITSEKLYDALYDHISFAIERLKMGLPIENPFITEIAIMCGSEYEVAAASAVLIKQYIDVDIGDAEKGFIALHLFSVRNDRHINTAMESVRVYNDAITLIGKRYRRNFDAKSSICRSFLMSLNQLVNVAAKQKTMDMPIKQFVRGYMSDEYKLANEISALLRAKNGAELSEESKAFLAVDICKLVQL